MLKAKGYSLIEGNWTIGIRLKQQVRILDILSLYQEAGIKPALLAKDLKIKRNKIKFTFYNGEERMKVFSEEIGQKAFQFPNLINQS